MGREKAGEDARGPGRALGGIRVLSFGLGVFAALGLFRAQAAPDEGLALLRERNCIACHAASPAAVEWLLSKSAPRLTDLGRRADPVWIRKFLLSPQVMLPGTTMPEVLHGLPENERAAAAEALTQHLVASGAEAFQRQLPDRAAAARGEALYHQVGCVACHAPQRASSPTTGAVPLPVMADKWSHDPLRRFLRDPLSIRPSGRMPAVPLSDAEASDIAHYLLRETRVSAPLEVIQYRGRIRALEDFDTAEMSRTARTDGFTLGAEGQDRRAPRRFTGWIRVEKEGVHTFHLTATGASRISVDERWLLGEDSWQREKVEGKSSLRLNIGWHPIVVDYVHRGSQPPALVVEWETPGGPREAIPATQLSREADPPIPTRGFVVDQSQASIGRDLYARLNCATCHEGRPPMPSLPALTALDPTRGCLAEPASTSAPLQALDAGQRTALRGALARLASADLKAPTATERLAQSLTAFRCTVCHARDGTGGVAADRDAFFTSNGEDLGEEGRLPPGLDGVGDRLRPDWLRRVLVEGAAVRPYLNTRMPQFGVTNVGPLTELFVQMDRRPQTIPSSPDPTDAQREAGRRLVGTDGLSCIACHRFNRQPAHTMQVLDLSTTTGRLNEDWFRQFLRDPNRFHPGTRMPAFWPDGVSALPAVLGGDMHRQHAALWTYLSEGTQAKFPEGLSRQNVELVVGGEAVVYRGKMWEAGFRAIATGYPGQLNVAFDAEEVRLALLWRGRFLNAGPHWGVQGMGRIRPLGSDVVLLPHGPSLAVLAAQDTPWPIEGGRESGLRFSGYQLDDRKQPTLLYRLGELAVEDRVQPLAIGTPARLRRTLKFTGAVPTGLHLRVAMGPDVAGVGDGWRIAEGMTVRITGGGSARVRGEGGKQELLVPISGGIQELEYVWGTR